MRILLVTPVSPCPTRTGGQQRTNLLYRALAEAGSVDTFLLCGEPDISADDRACLARQFNLVGMARPQVASEIGWTRRFRHLSPPHVNRIVNVLHPMRQFTEPHPRVVAALHEAVNLDAYDVIVSRYLSAAVACGILGRPRVVVDIDDLQTSVLDMRLTSATDNSLRRAYLGRIRKKLASVQKRQLARCAHAWVANPADLEALGDAPGSHLPNIPFVGLGQPEICDQEMAWATSSLTVLTVGMLSHVPNVRGIDDFLSSAWPAIRRRVPSAQYRIVGSRLDPQLADRWSRIPGVNVAGFVADLKPEYAAAAVTVCPIPWGGGTNIKVAESLAYGVPAVVSRPGHRGWQEIFREDECVLVAPTTDAFIEHVVALLGDVTRRRTMGEAGRQAVRQHLRFKAISRHVHATLEGVASIAAS